MEGRLKKLRTVDVQARHVPRLTEPYRRDKYTSRPSRPRCRRPGGPRV